MKSESGNYLDQEVVVSDGENLDSVARELIGPAGKATYTVLGYVLGAQWPVIRFRGTKRQLIAIEAKAAGHKVGKAGHKS
jgi:hypothetical protein